MRVGDAYRIIGDSEKSKELLTETLEKAKAIGNQHIEAKAGNLLGLIEMRLGEYKNALEYFVEAAKTFEELGDKRYTANAYFNMGIIFFNMEEPNNAQIYIAKVQAIAEEISTGSVTIGSLAVIHCPDAERPHYWIVMHSDQAADGPVVINTLPAPATMDPAFLCDITDNGYVAPLYAPLVAYGRTTIEGTPEGVTVTKENPNEIVPALAESWCQIQRKPPVIILGKSTCPSV